MKYINHRVNTINHLKQIPKKNGVELDVRYHNNDLILEHDPFNHDISRSEKLDNYLNFYKNHGPLILNIKSEGIEEECINLMLKHKIQDWFFLDISMPYLVKFSDIALQGNINGFTPDNLAVRFSENEPIEYALSFKDKARWVWVDCFTHLPLNIESYSLLKSAGFKICLVSPELQNHPLEIIQDFKTQVSKLDIDAVCTKRPDLWY